MEPLPCPNRRVEPRLTDDDNSSAALKLARILA